MMQPNPNLDLAGVGGTPTRIIRLTEAVTDYDLINDEDYNDLMEDLRDEGERFGKYFSASVSLATQVI